MNELEKHIKFTEKQLTVYKYHNHPDVLKMEALHQYLLNQKSNTNSIFPEKNAVLDDKNSAKNSTPQGSLFDTNKFKKENNT